MYKKKTKKNYVPTEQVIKLIGLYGSPPEDANVPLGYIWKLSKCVYGLNDASRFWYLTIKDELMKLGAGVSKYD